MKSIRVRNLRSFNNTSEQPFINIKPITIFVGKNSCGKSSLLRTFPLLRQSVEANTSGPFLWYGDYVDYGAFSEAINKNTTEESIFFDYKFDLAIYNKNSFIRRESQTRPVELSIEVIEKNKRTIAKSIKIKFNNTDISIDYSTRNIYIDDVKLLSQIYIYSPSNAIIPEISIEDFDNDNLHDFERTTFSNSILNEDDEGDEDDELLIYLSEIEDTYRSNSAISRDITLKIANILFNTIEKPTLKYDDFENSIVSSLSLLDPAEIKKILSSTFQLNRELTDSEINEIHRLCCINYLPLLIESINSYLNQFTKSIKYVAPLRATAERFYRFQDLRVEEIDHTGSNLAMLLRNLHLAEMKRFQEWSQKNFGFYVSVPETNSLHYEIKVTIDNETQNISDMGFGFSQILPIVTTLWLETSSPRLRRRRTSLTFVLEQPELHLHPEYQAILARVFASVALNYNNTIRKVNIIFETHSKTMIDAIGDFIEENNCPSLAAIYIFNKEDKITNVIESKFDEDGDLVNWPIGFFSGR
ncbi:DUF3696 domain-containing protein [Vibrio sinensis]|uniref:DUF3696 domain-containing protein n=1 Tax=Vibrio sinensis TaxID=2302434 RepID=A0A3A6R2S0_9VIBR|nr:AAA family ATPase [Vibrio sinensis]RJX70914.1 DUF3696 domain-containing protein [Vibrio sinensis]